MAPLPKRRHSTRRQGKRERTRYLHLKTLVVCPNCKHKKLPHRPCLNCGK